MSAIVSYFLIFLSVLLSVPVIVLFSELVTAVTFLVRKDRFESEAVRARVAVLVPAHNESAGILPTLNDIKTQLRGGDRLLVVADNCADDTAAAATSGGAEVIERNEPDRIGKGYALDFGIKYLQCDPPSVVIIVDADCRLDHGAIDRLARACATSSQPVQALYLMTAPDQSSTNFRAAEFAWRVKNWVRPLGLYALNLPCQLMGTGMAFPWDVVRSADLASGSIVEDLNLGLDLARMGHAPRFCPSAIVRSHFPWSAEGTRTQRNRWEEGHISTILKKTPRLFYEALARKNMDLLVHTLDMAVPPLSLLTIMLVGVLSVSGIAAFFGVAATALLINVACLGILVLAIFLTWLRYGRDILPPSAIVSAASYVLAKLPIYGRVLSRGVATEWARTDRKKSSE